MMSKTVGSVALLRHASYERWTLAVLDSYTLEPRFLYQEEADTIFLCELLELTETLLFSSWLQPLNANG